MVNKKSLDIIKVDSASDLEPHLGEWRKLSAGMPMRSPEWLLGWWECFAEPGDCLWILLLRQRGGMLVGLTPLYLRPNGELRLIGVADDCSQHLDWLSAPEWETLVGEEVAGFLLDHSSEWKKLILQAVDEDALAIFSTMERLARHGCLLHRRRIHDSWRIPLPESWDAYLDALSRSLRKRCRKLQRAYLNSGIVKLCQVEEEKDFPKGFKILVDLHAKRWGNAKNPLGIFTSRKFRLFHERIAKDLFAARKLRLAWLEYEDQPIAVEYQFYDHQTVYAYQAGIDLVHSELAPGKLTMMTAIRFAIEQGFESFDLLRGNDPYKANWRAVPSACYDLRLWRRRWSGFPGWLFWNTYTQFAGALKKVLPEPLINNVLLKIVTIKRRFLCIR